MRALFLAIIAAFVATLLGAPPASAAFTKPIPENLTSTAQTQNSITLAWDAVDGAARYRVQYSKSSSMSSASYPQFTTNSGTLTGLAANTRYYFRVRVMDADAKTGLSDYTGTPYPNVYTQSAPDPELTEEDGGALTTTPASVVANETVKFTGTFGSEWTSTALELQRRNEPAADPATWAKVATGTTSSSSGNISVSYPVSATSTYRVVAKKVSVGRSIITDPVTVTLAESTAALAMRQGSGTSSSADMTFTPARSGQTVTLQTQKGDGSWSNVGTAKQSSAGRATYTTSSLWPGEAHFRAVSSSATSDPVIFKSRQLAIDNDLPVIRINTIDKKSISTRETYIDTQFSIEGDGCSAYSTESLAEEPRLVCLPSVDDDVVQPAHGRPEVRAAGRGSLREDHAADPL